MDLDIFNISLQKATGVSGYEVPVDSVAFKSVDYATWRDSWDAQNYPIYAPYGYETVSCSYENWIRLKFSLKPEFKKNLYSNGLYLKDVDECTGKPTIYHYTDLKNIKIWMEPTEFIGCKIFYGNQTTYVKPVKTLSTVATTDISTIQMSEYDGTNIPSILFNGNTIISLNDLLNTESEYIIFQLQLFKGMKYYQANATINFKIHYDLSINGDDFSHSIDSMYIPLLFRNF